jgi:cell division protein YceG involved in septum cleavage
MKTLLRVLGALIVLAVLAVLVGGSWLWYGVYRDKSLPAAETQVVVERGSTFVEIARQLAEKRVISNVTSFRPAERRSPFG